MTYRAGFSPKSVIKSNVLESPVPQPQTPTVKTRNRQDSLTLINHALTKTHCANLSQFLEALMKVFCNDWNILCSQIKKALVATECLEDHTPHIPFPAHDHGLNTY